METQFEVNPNLKEIYKTKPKWNNNSVFLDCPVTLIYGQTVAGKTILLQNLIFKILLAKYKIEDIHVFSSSVLKDKTWNYFLKKMDKKSPDLFDTNIHTKMEGIPKLIKELGNKSIMNESKPTLILIDDMTGSNQLSNMQSDLSKFVTMCRHDNCAVIILCHKFKRISSLIRANCKQMMIGYSTENMIPVFEEIAAIFPRKIMNKMFELEVFNEKDKFNFLVVRKDLDVNQGMYRKNFNQILNPNSYY